MHGRLYWIDMEHVKWRDVSYSRTVVKSPPSHLPATLLQAGGRIPSPWRRGIIPSRGAWPSLQTSTKTTVEYLLITALRPVEGRLK
jgi:hypothetical protein